ncbi:MAG TPA: nucleotidyltransferase [Candidatus Campbellbacteria bacterium]|nr:nucleotidyltransferase [Candidatus Campbellbacteria bacterium]
MKKEEIKSIVYKSLPMIKEKYHVKQVGIFGSVARGTEKNDSDIDILVEFSSPIGFFDFMRLEKHLSEVLNKKVDLVSKKAIKPIIKKSILDEVIYV